MSATEEKYYWLPHPTLVWVPAKVLSDDGGLTQYITSYEEVIQHSNDKLPLASLERVSDSSMSVPGIQNLVNLDEFGEGAVIHQLRERYKRDLIYTTIGSILVSINPYTVLPIYSTAKVDAYAAAAKDGQQTLYALDPHVYTIAAEAYTKLYEDDYSPSVKPNQACIISGESGSGKTEVTKIILQYLSEVAGSIGSGPSGGSEEDDDSEQRPGEDVASQILMSNPILEAFGNAQTLRNNNSSRFGKWMEIHFQPLSPTGGSTGKKIIAARIINYLLEKSRVTVQTKGERSYHIMYQLCAGLSDELKTKFGLGKCSDYHFLNQGGTYTINGVSDSHEFESTQKAMKQLRFNPETIESIWQLLSGVLQIGNLTVEPNPQKPDHMIISNKSHLQRTTETLGLPSPDLVQTALCYRSVIIRGSLSMIPLTLGEVQANRDALAKTIYAKLFDHIILQMNQVLFAAGDQTPQAQKTDRQKKCARSIGILDIFGFEIFNDNLFEQFCINYCNEKLQQHFNTHIFKMEQAEYLAEGIDVAQILFVDNLECLQLIENRPIQGQSASAAGAPAYQGILSMLDEELFIPRGSDHSLITKMHAAFASKGKEHKYYGQVKKHPETFIIKHYAGEVVYNSAGLLAKNANKLHENLEVLMTGGSSSLRLLSDIFASKEGRDASTSSADERKEQPPVSPQPPAAGAHFHRRSNSMSNANNNSPSNAAKKKEATLAFQFSGQLQDLMSTLHACNPHYIRCLKPNNEKKKQEFDTKMVLKQMSYAGLFEAIRIRKSGFPFRKALDEFGRRYKGCLLDVEGGKKLQEFNRLFAGNVSEGVFFLLSTLTPKYLTSGMYQVGRTKVFMKTQQRNILDTLRDANLSKSIVIIQKNYRMARCRKLKKKLKAFEAECIKELDTRDCTEDSLTTLLNTAHELNYHHHLFILKRLRTTIVALSEVSRINSLLDDSLENGKDSDLFESALEQVTKLQSTYPTIVPKDDLLQKSKIVLVRKLAEKQTKARAQRDHLLDAQRITAALHAAVLAEDMAVLRKVIDEATKFGDGIEKLDVFARAKVVLEQLIVEEALMESLRQATTARDVVLLEKYIAAIQTGGIALDEKRHADMTLACKVMHEVCDEAVRTLLDTGHESQLKVLLAKMQELNYTDLVNDIEKFLKEAQAERERIAVEAELEKVRRAEEDARRAEEEAAAAAAALAEAQAAEKAAFEEARRAEEVRLAAERANMEEAERLRLEAEDRVRREKEDEERNAKAAAEAARVAAATEAAEAEREKARLAAQDATAKAAAASAAAAASSASSSSSSSTKAAGGVPPPPPPPPKGAHPSTPPTALESLTSGGAAPDSTGRASVSRSGPPKSAPPASAFKKGVKFADEDETLPPPPSGSDVDVDLPPPPPPELSTRSSTQAHPGVNFGAPPGPPTNEHPLDIELNVAISTRSVPALEKALASANALKYNGKVVRQAQNLLTNLTTEGTLRQQLSDALDRVDLPALKALIKSAGNLGLTKDPLVEEARNLCYGLSPSDLLSLRIEKALPYGNVDELRKLLHEAAEMKPLPLANDQTEQVKDFLAAQISRRATTSGNYDAYRTVDWNTTMRMNRSKVVPATLYNKWISTRGQFPLNETNFLPLRRAGNYSKGHYLTKTSLKANRLSHQTDKMPRSLVKLSTEYCGGKEKSKLIKAQAMQIFKSIRQYMRDSYHSYPVTLAYDVVQTAVAQPLLRDEILCQLIKQTSNNPDAESELLGLKLMYLCLSTYEPSSGLKLCLFSHLAQFAHPILPDSAALGLQTAADIASSCFTAMEHVSALAAANIPVKAPTMSDVEAMTMGALAKRSGRFDDPQQRGRFHTRGLSGFVAPQGLVPDDSSSSSAPPPPPPESDDPPPPPSGPDDDLPPPPPSHFDSSSSSSSLFHAPPPPPDDDLPPPPPGMM